MINAGRFGARNPVVKNIQNLVIGYMKNKKYFYGIDEQFLTDVIYPMIQNSVFIHSHKNKNIPTTGESVVGKQIKLS
jgi:hypothetical protein